MRLTLVIAGLTPGGAERVLSGLANHWSNQGHDVTLLTLSGANDTPFYPLNGQVQLKGLNVMLPNGVAGVSRLLHMIKRVMTLRMALKKSKPDVVVSFVDVTNLTTLLASLGTGMRVVVSERIDPHYYHLPCVYVWLRKVLYPWADQVVVQTQSAARYFNLGNLRIIANPVKPASVKTLILPYVKHIVSVGRLSKQKDFPTLIKAFARVCTVYNDVALTIYGDGPERPYLEAMINQLGLSERIFLPGAVGPIEEVFSRSDLFIFPSRFEGFPNALCEAMAAGLPIIASNCSGNVDVVRDGVDGLLFPIGDVEMLTSLMLGLMNDADKRKSLGEQAITIVQRFDQKSMLASWDGILL